MSASPSAISRPAPPVGELAAASPAERVLGRLEIATLGGLVALQLALRIDLARRSGFDSDEPQHLHVVWA